MFYLINFVIKDLFGIKNILKYISIFYPLVHIAKCASFVVELEVIFVSPI